MEKISREIYINSSMCSNRIALIEKEKLVELYIDFPRSDLIERINVRTKKMLENGSLMEVRKFLRLRIPENKSITKAIGIKEIKDLINKKLTYEQVIEKISIKTRQYAKRQVTWARGNMKDWKKKIEI